MLGKCYLCVVIYVMVVMCVIYLFILFACLYRVWGMVGNKSGYCNSNHCHGSFLMHFFGFFSVLYLSVQCGPQRARAPLTSKPMWNTAQLRHWAGGRAVAGRAHRAQAKPVGELVLALGLRWQFENVCFGVK